MSYTYDTAGRRIKRSLAGQPDVSYTYDDANGNMTSDGSRALTWNARNQLIGLSGGSSANFQYDAMDRRIAKNISGVSTGFLFDDVNAIQENSGSAHILTGGIDEFFQRNDTSGSLVPITDGLGSVLALLDSSGTAQTQYSYDPFGNTSTNGNTSSNASQYTGRENDGTGLYYYRARYYSPKLQRFLSVDPIGFRGGVNFYS